MNKALRNLSCTILALAWPVASLRAQSQSSSSPPRQSSQGTQASSQAQPQQNGDSVAEAARKAKEKRAAAAQRKVFTEDDLSGMRKDGISVVGDENNKSVGRALASSQRGNNELKNEKYWRGRAQPILNKIADLDRQIAEVEENIKKYGSSAFDVTTGMKAGVAYVEDRNGQIQKLQKKRADLQKQLDDVQEEGRKAGAEPAWFR